MKELEDLQKQEKVEEVEDLKKLNELKGEKSLEGLEDLSDLIEIEGLSELKSREESTELNESTELEMGNSSVALLERKARLLIHDLTFSTIVKDQLQKVISRIRAGSLDKAEVSKIGTMVGEIEARITICRKLSESLQQLQGIKNLPENLAMQLQKIHEELSGELPQRDRLSNVANLLMRIQRVIRDQKSEEVRSAELLSEDFEKRSHEFSAEEELFVANSGIVIFWPFLTRFFENLGLIENQKFINNSSAHRAVGLLQFLVDGILEPREYNCGLNKVLCGLVWDSVLDFGDPVTDHEKSQCEQFLQSVIANAPVLKDMSIEGFRSSFLMRKGMLKGGPGLWQLFVEKQTYDIVLEKFPWNWKMFKLTWMQWPMEVEWV